MKQNIRNLVTCRQKFAGQYCNQLVGIPDTLQDALLGGSNNGKNTPAPPTQAFFTSSYNIDVTPGSSSSGANCDQSISIAICMPDSCNNDDVKRAVDTCKAFESRNLFFQYWKRTFSVTNGTLSSMGLLCDAQCISNEKTLPKSADTIAWVAFAGVVAVIALFGTFYDYSVYHPQLKARKVPNSLSNLLEDFSKCIYFWLAISKYWSKKLNHETDSIPPLLFPIQL